MVMLLNFLSPWNRQLIVRAVAGSGWKNHAHQMDTMDICVIGFSLIQN